MTSVEDRLREYLAAVEAYMEPNYPYECGETLEQWLARRRAGDGPKMPMDPHRTIWTNLDDTYVSAEEHAAHAAESLGKLSNLRRERLRISPFIGAFAVDKIPGDREELADGGCIVEQLLIADDPDGNEVRIPLCVIFFVRDGQIVKLHEYSERF